MEKLYLDNFRGFSDQIIEIRDVNFLVGENSSGKSSVLIALNTISSPGFWFNLDFYSGDAQIYSFEDLVSVEAEDKSNFKIGYLYDDEEKISYILEFRNHSGKPVIYSGIVEQEKTLFIFSHEKDKINYSIVKNERLTIDKFKSLSKQNIQQQDTITIRAGFIPPITLLQMFESATTNKKNSYHVRLPISDISAIAPIRSKPRKTYDEPGTLENPEGDHIPYAIRKLFNTKADLFQNINTFGTQSGLFRKIGIKEYGSADDAPFRMNFVLNKKPINIINVGYGVSQVLPILVSMYTQNNSIISIQQPEVHLHPRAQAAMGNIFFDLSFGENKKKLIIETHSDYIIDRFRQKQRISQEKSDVHVLFFLREKGTNKIFPIKIDDRGNYDSNQPKEFREFFIKEELENLGL